MDEKTKLQSILEQALESKGLTDATYRSRLKQELKEIDAQWEYDYLLDLHFKKIKFAENENNLLVAFLLDLCDSVDLDRPPYYVQGESPDADIDYLPKVRDHLKNEWAPKTFGRDKICSIGTYGTLGIRMALLDSTKVHGVPKDEIQAITKILPDKDDDDKPTTWETAMQICPPLADYCQRNSEIAKAAKMLTDRNKSGGVHAGGLIISSKPIADFVPLEVRSVSKDNPKGVIVSAWTEGQTTQDLQPVGLIKFDLLVVEGLMQIALACKLINDRHGLKTIFALPGKRSWSDISFLNDDEALKMADKADLKCIFQFGSEGMRKLVKKGGVKNFDDLAAFAALYRPGPLSSGMAEKYCLRKQGQEKYEIHPLMRRFLSTTYGVLVYQEQVMQVLHAVGNIPLAHCEKVRKAISKKKYEQFAKYKDMFLENGQKNLGESLEYVQDLWGQIEAFAAYGFNKSIFIDTLIPTPGGDKRLGDFVLGDVVYGVDENGNTVEVPVVALHDHGTLNGYEVTFDDGSTVICSQNHKFLTPLGQMSLWKICQTQTLTYCAQPNKKVAYEGRPKDPLQTIEGYKEGYVDPQQGGQSYRLEEAECGGEAAWEYHASAVEHGVFQKFVRRDENRVVAATPGHAGIADTSHLVLRRIVRVVSVGKRRMCDLEVAINTHNFLLTNGVVTSNSHTYAYTYISAMQLCLKAHYPLEFYTSLFMCEDDSDKIKQFRLDAQHHKIELKPVHINKSKQNFSIVDNDIYYGFANLKKLGVAVADRIVASQPYSSISDFLERFGTEATALKPLISVGAFEDTDDRLRLYKFYEYYKDFHTRRREAVRRNETAMKKYHQDLLNILTEHCSGPEEVSQYNSFQEPIEDKWQERFGSIVLQEEYRYKGEIRTRPITVAKMLVDVKRKVESSIRNFKSREKEAQEAPPNIHDFNPDRVRLDEKVQKLFEQDTKLAEREYYGFQWVHELEESPDYEGWTIERYTQELEQNKETCVEVKILEAKKRNFKNGKGFSFDVHVEDADGKEIWVKFWSDDYERFAEDLTVNNLIRIRIKPPLGNFLAYSFEAPPRHLRWKLPRNKEDDCRLYVLKRSEPKQPQMKAAPEKKATNNKEFTFIDLENL